MKNIYLSIPFENNQQFKIDRNKIIKKVNALLVDEAKYHDSLNIERGDVGQSLFNLGKGISAMSFCDTAVFHKYWRNNRSCRMEHTIAEEYGLRIIDLSKL